MVEKERDVLMANAMLDREVIGQPEEHDRPSMPVPKKLNDAPYHGLMGDIVNAIHPHTESSREAIIYSLVSVLGCLVGRNRYAIASGSKHASNDFVVLVGKTGSGRKGSSFPHIRYAIGEVESEEWIKNNIQGGVSSGEGLITPVEDDLYSSDGTLVEVGKLDKRLLLVETEFASAFQVMSRLGNTLSPKIRQAFDTGDLATMTKRPRTATNAHISFLCHITPEELEMYLNDVTSANGFGNRFLYAFTHRDKELPDGGGLPEWGNIPERFSKVLEHAKTERILTRTPEASKLWQGIYHELSESASGFVGALCGRAEAHALRVQVLYAILDRSDYIDVNHVMASLELIRYSEDSVRYIFGNKTGNKVADKILDGLTEKGFMTRTLIHGEIFSNNSPPKALLDKALAVLMDNHLIKAVTKDFNGKPMTGYEAV